MPLALRLYEHAEARLHAEGLGINMVAARGPMVTAGWVMGITDLMMGLVTHPKEVTRFLTAITTTIIRWLHAQLDILHNPEGIMHGNSEHRRLVANPARERAAVR